MSPTSADPKSPSDQDLITRAQAGDEAAFGQLMQLHYEHTFRLVVAIIRREHDARDACQDIWLTVWKNLKTYRGDSKFTTWLHPIATRRAIDHLRRGQRWYTRFLPFASDPDSPEIQIEPTSPENPYTHHDQQDRAARFEQALAALPPTHRAVITLREIQGLSYDEIAHALQCPPGTVMSRLHHARRLLARQLKATPEDKPE